MLVHAEEHTEPANKLFNTLTRVAGPLGMRVAQPKRCLLTRYLCSSCQLSHLVLHALCSDGSAYISRVVVREGTRSAHHKFPQSIRANIDGSIQMVLVLLPTNNKQLYEGIKKLTCIDTPVPSQCVTLAKIRKEQGLMSVVTKIAIQLNCKLGGEPWAVHNPVCGFYIELCHYLAVLLFFALMLMPFCS